MFERVFRFLNQNQRVVLLLDSFQKRLGLSTENRSLAGSSQAET